MPCLCLVTDRNQCEGRPLEQVVDQAVDGGVNLVQLREKDLPASRLYELGRRLKSVIAGRALLFVNDRVDVALACGADGVQLGEEGMPLEAARVACDGRFLLGRSVHSIEGAVAAQDAGADLLVLGTIFQTGSHPGAHVSGVGLVKQVTLAVNTPVLAIGGIGLTNAASVMDSGAHGVAVISAITRSPDPRNAARALMSEIRSKWAGQPSGRTLEAT